MSHENIIAILSVVISAIVAGTSIIIAWQTERLLAMRDQLSVSTQLLFRHSNI